MQDYDAHVQLHSQPKQKPKHICENCGKDWKFASKLAIRKKSCLKNLLPKAINELLSELKPNKETVHEGKKEVKWHQTYFLFLLKWHCVINDI